MKSIFDIDCSMFENATATAPQSVNLLQWLQSDKYLPQQQRIRSLTGTDRDAAKKTMPCITPSGLFSKRGKGNLLKHTGLIAIDIDLKDNLHLSNFAALKKELCKISNVAYCGLSVSGKGYWLLIRIAYPEKHEDHFRFIENYFAANGLKIDAACKDVARLRFYSYDPDAYFNNDAKLLQAVYSPVSAKPMRYRQTSFNAENKPVWEQYNESADFVNVLQRHGWDIESKRGAKMYFTRPGKGSGISAEYDSSKGVFYIFTSNAPRLEGGRGYNPFQVYAILEHSSDFNKAAKALKPYNSRAVSFNIPESVKKPIGLPIKRQEVQPDPQQSPAVELFKAALLKEAKQTGNGIADKCFETYRGQGLTQKDALAAVYELSREHGFRIDEDTPPPEDALKTCLPLKDSWQNEVDELEHYFSSVELPLSPIRLNSFTHIENLSALIHTHLKTLRANDGNNTFLPFLSRLKEIKVYLLEIK